MNKRILRKYFIPHEANEYQPHLLRRASIFRLSIVAVLLLIGTSFQSVLLSRLDLTAAILPRVLVDFTNESREENGLAPLKINSLLEKAALLKAEDMAKNGYFSHTSPDGLTPWHWFGEAGYLFSAAGENLAVDFVDSGAVNKAWLNSPRHRANILGYKFTEIGIAAARGNYQGKETLFVVQMFGHPFLPFVQTTADPLPELAKTVVETIPAKANGAEELRVAGEAVGPVTASSNGVNVNLKEGIKKVYEDESLIVMKVLESAENEISPLVSPLPVLRYASFIERLIVSPGKILGMLYFLLGAVVSASFLLAVAVEVRKQHLLHAAYASLLILFMVALIFFNWQAKILTLLLKFSGKI